MQWGHPAAQRAPHAAWAWPALGRLPGRGVVRGMPCRYELSNVDANNQAYLLQHEVVASPAVCALLA